MIDSEAILKNFIPVVDALAEAFGEDCEVVLHDLSKPKESIIKIVNGHVTNRKVGDPIGDLVLTVLRSDKFDGNRLVNYASKANNGKLLKSTTILIRDFDNNVIGSLCLNIDMSKYMMAKKLLVDICEMDDLSKTFQEDNEDDGKSEYVVDILKKMISNTLSHAGKTIDSMNKDDKLEIVKFLDEKGLFLIKGSIDHLASEFNVSRYTIYNYVEEVRAKRINS